MVVKDDDLEVNFKIILDQKKDWIKCIQIDAKTFVPLKYHSG